MWKIALVRRSDGQQAGCRQSREDPRETRQVICMPAAGLQAAAPQIDAPVRAHTPHLSRDSSVPLATMRAPSSRSRTWDHGRPPSCCTASTPAGTAPQSQAYARPESGAARGGSGNREVGRLLLHVTRSARCGVVAGS
jgi:hypothetical protein